jgi:hypothetical protein
MFHLFERHLIKKGLKTFFLFPGRFCIREYASFWNILSLFKRLMGITDGLLTVFEEIALMRQIRLLFGFLKPLLNKQK